MSKLKVPSVSAPGKDPLPGLPPPPPHRRAPRASSGAVASSTSKVTNPPVGSRPRELM